MQALVIDCGSGDMGSCKDFRVRHIKQYLTSLFMADFCSFKKSCSLSYFVKAESDENLCVRGYWIETSCLTQSDLIEALTVRA